MSFIPKVFVADPVSSRGVEALAEGGVVEVVVKTGLKEEELIKIIPDFHGLVVRSQTKVTPAVFAAAKNLKVVGRAGVGIDNVDVEAATKHGVIVMNAPGGNTISTAEHAFSLMLATARYIPQADASMKAGKWDRKTFEGVELHGKTIAILGMGRIGTEVARRATAFGMKVLAYDPYISASKAKSLQVEVVDKVDDILPLADFITVHMPLTEETRHMIGRKQLPLLKKGVRIVNCARGGLIDEEMLAEGLRSGLIGGAALDVFEVEPLPAEWPFRDVPNLVLTPHLGTILGQNKVNIASMSLSRNEVGGQALTLLNLDSAPDEPLLAKVTSDADISSAKVIKL